METIQYPTKTKALKNHRCMFCSGIIEKGTTYLKSVHKYDEVYTWKAHEPCSKITTKLKMYEQADEGVDMDYFMESIKNEYQQIMIDLHSDRNFTYPKFQEQLKTVLNHHSIKPEK